MNLIHPVSVGDKELGFANDGIIANEITRYNLCIQNINILNLKSKVTLFTATFYHRPAQHWKLPCDLFCVYFEISNDAVNGNAKTTNKTRSKNQCNLMATRHDSCQDNEFMLKQL